MTAEQQLERSVLERKEREELRAIAQAMSLDTNSRSKKADIIDQILRAAGVEVSAGSANGGSRRACSAESRGPELRRRTVTPRTSSSTATRPTGPGPDARAPTAARRPRLRRSVLARPPQPDPQVSWFQTGVPTASDGSPRPDRPRTSPLATSRRRSATARAPRRGPSPPSGRQGRRPARTRTASTCSRAANANEPGNRRGRRRRGRERTPGGGGGGGERELQGGGQEAQYSGELIPVRGLLDLRDEGLRLPPGRGIPAELEGRLHLDQPGASLRHAPG